MTKQTVCFRLPVDSLNQVNHFVKLYGYRNKGELYALILAGSVSFKYKRVDIGSNTVIQGARISPGLSQSIKERAASQLHDSVSVWCALAVKRWLFMEEMEVERNQGQRFYSDWCKERAELHRQRVRA